MYETGTVVGGKYRIISIVGRGGMGAVYEAESLQLGKIWAIKELAPPLREPDEIRRYATQFQTEARLLAHLEHHGLPRVVDYFEEDSSHYFLVMDFIHGRDMQQVRRDCGGAIEEATVLRWTDEILEILSYLHMLVPPVIVRDIKPSNIMLTDRGRIKLIDFGLAKLVDPSLRTVAAIRGSGSPGFAPIEQYRGLGTDQRADIYALGATLYYLLTGVVPPDSMNRLMDSTPLVPISQFNAAVSEKTWNAIATMMAVPPAQRPSSVHEVRILLGLEAAAAQHSSPVTETPSTPSTGKGLGAPGLSSSSGNQPIRGAPVQRVVDSGTPTNLRNVVEPSSPNDTRIGDTAEPVGATAMAREFLVLTDEVKSTGETAEAPYVRPRHAATASERVLAPTMANRIDGSELVLIPEGEFWMGGEAEEGREDELPQVRLYLPDFYLARYPVTFRQYTVFVGATGYRARGDWAMHYKPTLADHPVTGVTLADAIAYCDWAQARLPWECEYEKSARGVEGYRYPWGNAWDPNRCNNWLTDDPALAGRRADFVTGRGTSPVSAFKEGASSFGICDLTGNVGEWTATVYGRYPYQHDDGRDTRPAVDNITPTWPYVLRGGDWSRQDSSDFRCAARFWSYPTVWSRKRGFRIARSIDPS